MPIVEAYIPMTFAEFVRDYGADMDNTDGYTAEQLATINAAVWAKIDPEATRRPGAFFDYCTDNLFRQAFIDMDSGAL